MSARPPKTIAGLRALALKTLTSPGVHDPSDPAHLLARGVLGLLDDLKAIADGTVELPPMDSTETA